MNGLVIVNAFLRLKPEGRSLRLALYDLLLEEDGPSRWADQLLRLMGVEHHRAIVRGFRRSLDRLDPRHIRRVFREQVDWDQRPDLQRISCPVLIVRGERDSFIPAYCVDDMVEGLHDGQLVALDAGHLPYLEAPADFNRCVSDFLARPMALPDEGPDSV